jgi:hypothetical protein
LLVANGEPFAGNLWFGKEPDLERLEIYIGVEAILKGLDHANFEPRTETSNVERGKNTAPDDDRPH